MPEQSRGGTGSFVAKSPTITNFEKPLIVWFGFLSKTLRLKRHLSYQIRIVTLRIITRPALPLLPAREVTLYKRPTIFGEFDQVLNMASGYDCTVQVLLMASTIRLPIHESHSYTPPVKVLIVYYIKEEYKTSCSPVRFRFFVRQSRRMKDLLISSSTSIAQLP